MVSMDPIDDSRRDPPRLSPDEAREISEGIARNVAAAGEKVQESRRLMDRVDRANRSLRDADTHIQALRVAAELRRVAAAARRRGRGRGWGYRLT